MSCCMQKDNSSHSNKINWQENHKNKSHHIKDALPGIELWTDGLICAFEHIGVLKKKTRPKSHSKIHSVNKIDVEITMKEVPTCELTEASFAIESGRKLIESTSLIGLRGCCIIPLEDNIESWPYESGHLHSIERLAAGSHWVPIGWARISELVQTIQVDAGWVSQRFDIMDDEDDLTVADLAAPYWERVVLKHGPGFG